MSMFNTTMTDLEKENAVRLRDMGTQLGIAYYNRRFDEFEELLRQIKATEITFMELAYSRLVRCFNYLKKDSLSDEYRTQITEIIQKWRLEIIIPHVAPGQFGTCGVCKGNYLDRSPMVAWCGHVFCKPCIEDSLNVFDAGEIWKCPLCRKKLKSKKMVHPLHF